MLENKKNIGEVSKSETVNSKPGIEIVPGNDLEQLEDTLSVVANLVAHDDPVFTANLEDIDSAAADMKVDVGGVLLDVEEIEKIPHLKENAKIWQEIKDGLFEHVKLLEYIPDEIAAILSTYKGSLMLWSLENLSLSAAKCLGKFDGWLDLLSIVSTTDKILEQLSFHKGYLNLENLNSLSDKGAEFLSHHDGRIVLRKLKNISDKGLEHLAGFTGGLDVSHELLVRMRPYYSKKQ